MESKKRRKRRKRRYKKSRVRLRKFNIFALIVNLILLVLVSIISFLILKYDILPLKYLIVYFLLLVGIPLLILFFLLRRKTNFKVKIFLIIIDFLFIALVGFALHYVSETFEFLDEFANSASYTTRNYMVLVPNDSEYEKIEELDKKTIGYIVQEVANYKKALGELNKTITFTNKDYLDYTTIFEAFKLKEVDAILSTDSYYDSLCEEVETFETDYKIIYKFSVREKIENLTKDVDVTKEVFNVYISGMDTYGDISTISRSDVNIVMSVNPKTNQILMVNIPRDYYVVFHGQTNKDKLTHAGLYGTGMSLKTIEDILDIDINYYFKVNFNSVEKVVDALGGVDVYSQYTFRSTNGYYFRKGYNHVNGKQALGFARTRKVLTYGDVDRGRNQEALIQAIIKKATSSAILTRYTTILDSLKDSFYTNMSSDRITDIIKMQIDRMPKWNTTSMSLTGFGAYDYTSVFPDKKVYVMLPNEDTIKEAKSLLDDVKNGKTLESTYQENTGDVYDPFIPKPTPTPKPDTTTDTNKDEDKEEEKTETKPDDNKDTTNEDDNKNQEPDNNDVLLPKPDDNQTNDETSDNQDTDTNQDTPETPSDDTTSSNTDEEKETSTDTDDNKDITEVIPGITN